MKTILCLLLLLSVIVLTKHLCATHTDTEVKKIAVIVALYILTIC